MTRADTAHSNLVSPGVFVLVVGPGAGQRLGLLLQQPECVQQLIQGGPGLGPAPSRTHHLQILAGHIPGVGILQWTRTGRATKAIRERQRAVGGGH